MMAVFCLGCAAGAFITACVAGKLFRAQEQWCRGRLDYWSHRVHEMQEQVNELQAALHDETDGADWWKGQE